jgi:hypothetical protein
MLTQRNGLDTAAVMTATSSADMHFPSSISEFRVHSTVGNWPVLFSRTLAPLLWLCMCRAGGLWHGC